MCSKEVFGWQVKEMAVFTGQFLLDGER